MSDTASHPRPAPPRRSGIELSTLFVAGVASAVAAIVVSKVWSPGTIWATAFTPIVVSLIKEALERPAQRVSAVASRAVVPPRPLARATRTLVAPPPEAAAPPPPMVVDPALTERRVYGRRSGLGRRWKITVATGLLAFACIVALFTVPELVAGRSVTSSSSHTTLFGGHGSSPGATTKPRTTTSTTPAQTQQQAPTTTAPAPTQTAPTPPTTATPPAQTTPAPVPAPAPGAPPTTTAPATPSG